MVLDALCFGVFIILTQYFINITNSLANNIKIITKLNAKYILSYFGLVLK